MKNKRTYKELLKSLSWMYIILAVCGVIIGILFAAVPGIGDAIKGVIPDDGGHPLLYVETTIIVEVLIYLWYFWLVKRFVDGTSKGTVLLVLLILGAIGTIIDIIFGSGQRVESIATITDLLALYWLIRARNEEL